ncbi:MAG: Rne/Rng family ribonuclease, partial [Bdellovibrio sp.]|nr:Rne/Rng family ribonuclease [Bdellovibrio sp.]
MGRDPNDKDGESSESTQPEGTIAPETSATKDSTPGDSQEAEVGADAAPSSEREPHAQRKRHRRGRRGGGRFRKKGSEGQTPVQANVKYPENFPENYPENFHDQVADTGNLDSDRSGVANQNSDQESADSEVNRPETGSQEANGERRVVVPNTSERGEHKAEFRSQRSRDRRIRPKTSSRPIRNQVNIQDLLKEGQEVLVQVAKDPIATKGARLTCHISLPGRHLVCMPTIDHVGVSRRIEREDERRRLREYVERNRPRNLGFIVRTASGKQQSEKRIKQDIEYLTHLWNEIREKAAEVTAPALVYEDLNAVLRAIRDWVNEDIDKVIVDSRYHYNEIQRFVSHFMPPLKQKVELYHGDIPVFDAYNISTELSRALERKVWLKSGGYIVIDQAEALVAIDVNTGRYVGKKNLEDTILKTNLEAVQEIAYQLRLRNCGGIIILDLIDMEKDENKQRVYRALEDALSRDRARPTILKISELGLVEMTRKRTRDTIVRTLCESCTHCEGKGFVKAKQTVAYEILRELE